MGNTIDCRGLACPQPVINTKKYFDNIESGEAVIIVDNEIAKNNISKFAANSGLRSDIEEKDGRFYIRINKGEISNHMELEQEIKGGKGLAIVISSDKLGNGDDTLGALLMKSYLYALSENDTLPENIIFLNSGVKLSTEGSESIESLKKLQEKGTNITSCGTCLDFYSLKEKLLVGEIGNMYTIVEKMNTSANTIKL
jgi:selenium metabolism protein YedF